MNKKRRNALAAAGLLLGSGILSVVLIGSRERPARTPPAARAPAVGTETVREHEGPLPVRGSGTVRPKAQVSLAPQVGGRVAYEANVLDTFRRHRHLKPKGIAELNPEGEELARQMAEELAEATDEILSEEEA